MRPLAPAWGGRWKCALERSLRSWSRPDSQKLTSVHRAFPDLIFEENLKPSEMKLFANLHESSHIVRWLEQKRGFKWFKIYSSARSVDTLRKSRHTHMPCPCFRVSHHPIVDDHWYKVAAVMYLWVRKSAGGEKRSFCSFTGFTLLHVYIHSITQGSVRRYSRTTVINSLKMSEMSAMSGLTSEAAHSTGVANHGWNDCRLTTVDANGLLQSLLQSLLSTLLNRSQQVAAPHVSRVSIDIDEQTLTFIKCV